MKEPYEFFPETVQFTLIIVAQLPAVRGNFRFLAVFRIRLSLCLLVLFSSLLRFFLSFTQQQIEIFLSARNDQLQPVSLLVVRLQQTKQFRLCDVDGMPLFCVLRLKFSQPQACSVDQLLELLQFRVNKNDNAARCRRRWVRRVWFSGGGSHNLNAFFGASVRFVKPL